MRCQRKENKQINKNKTWEFPHSLEISEFPFQLQSQNWEPGGLSELMVTFRFWFELNSGQRILEEKACKLSTNLMVFGILVFFPDPLATIYFSES